MEQRKLKIPLNVYTSRNPNDLKKEEADLIITHKEKVLIPNDKDYIAPIN